MRQPGEAVGQPVRDIFGCFRSGNRDIYYCGHILKRHNLKRHNLERPGFAGSCGLGHNSIRSSALLLTKGGFVMEAVAVPSNVVLELKGSGKRKQWPSEHVGQLVTKARHVGPHGTGVVKSDSVA